MLGSRDNGQKGWVPFVGLKGKEGAVMEPGRATREGETFQDLSSVMEEYRRLGNLAEKEHRYLTLILLLAFHLLVELHRNLG